MKYSDKYIASSKYNSYIRKSLTHTYNWLHGSIRSMKSVAHAHAYALNILASKDTLHIVAGTTAIVAKSVWIDNDGLGLAHIFEGVSKMTKYEGHPALQIDLSDKTVTVLILGMANAGSYKSFRGMSIGMVGFTEIDLLDPETVEEAIRRTAASKHRRFFFDNNPQGPSHPIYSEDLSYSIERLLKTIPEKVNYMEVTLRDNPALSDERIKEIESEYDPESMQYKRFILGQRVDAIGLIYRLMDWNYLDTIDTSEYVGYSIVADPGENMSATVFLLVAITKGFKELHVLKEYYHRNADVKGHAIKMPIDYAEDYVQFIRESISLMGGRYPDMVFTDLDITFQRELRNALTRNKMANINFKDAVKEDIEERIRMGISLMWNKKLKFYKECTYTIDSFKTAMYDPNKSAKGVFERYDEPIKGTRIDAIDATEYIMSYYANKLYRR